MLSVGTVLLLPGIESGIGQGREMYRQGEEGLRDQQILIMVLLPVQDRAIPVDSPIR